MVSDVTVLGLMVPTTVLEDIGMDVPHGVPVTIPADLAYKSRDLWRAISQRLVFRVQPGPFPQRPFQAADPKPIESPRLDRAVVLEEENRRLNEEMARQKAEFQKALTDQNSKLAEILQLLQRAPTVIMQAPTAQGTMSVPRKDPSIVSDVAPTFIPATITPEHTQSRIGTRKEESENASISDAASKLRQLRQKRGQ